MTRYVLVEFEDNEEAEGFVKAIRGANARDTVAVSYMIRHEDRPDHYSIHYVEKGLHECAMWAKPTKFCDCHNPIGESRGKKYGWMVHNACGRPIPGRTLHPTNLLDDNPPEYPGASGLYLGYRIPTKD